MIDVRQLHELPVAERLELVEDLWDSIAREPGELRLSAAQVGELDRRLERLEDSPDEGAEWDTLKARIVTAL